VKISLIGSGWLAKPLALQFQADGHEIILTSTQQDKIAALNAVGLKALQYELGDQLSNPSQLFDTDVLIIAITSKDTEAFDVLMDQLSEQPCQHIIYISSTSVYQNNKQTHDENSQQLNQDNPIWQIEQLIQSHSSATVIRFAGLVGPGRHPGRFFANGKKLFNASAPVNLIHLDDCIGIIKAVIETQSWNQVFNGCADTHPSKLTFYQQAAKQYGAADPITEDSQTSSYKIIDNTKLKTILGYQLIQPDVLNMRF